MSIMGIQLPNTKSVFLLLQVSVLLVIVEEWLNYSKHEEIG
ncbi:hypothetical protein Runsl_3265 [Runella slithyformis DSM 19594]|uniref:Uncharacterized protein n=1 Tax=Runella slithyformis (strain ATCC 29530 / DSM 19594 / LMG 11500 / NCIMB 11436 / LSU 4) TaxID=761193 RepID=A0A7U3ZLX5_RUNSL|nr:hypothetical protein Runsl_3265 [Runella slithyformis DSM 19594]